MAFGGSASVFWTVGGLKVSIIVVNGAVTTEKCNFSDLFKVTCKVESLQLTENKRDFVRFVNCKEVKVLS